jgi:hypothetical protein
LTLQPAPGVALALTPVESSHIAAIGYLQAERVLLVRYKDGALWAWGGVQPPNWESLQMAVSKGQWMATWARVTAMPGIMISKGVMPTERPNDVDPVSVAEPGGNASPSPGPLNVIDEEASPCCRMSLDKSLAKFPNATIMSCGQCGQEFALEILWPNRYWRCKPAVAIVKPRW